MQGSYSELQFDPHHLWLAYDETNDTTKLHSVSLIVLSTKFWLHFNNKSILTDRSLSKLTNGKETKFKIDSPVLYCASENLLKSKFYFNFQIGKFLLYIFYYYPESTATSYLH